MRITKEIANILDQVFQEAASMHYEYVTPEQLLMAIAKRNTFRKAFGRCGGDIDLLVEQLTEYIKQEVEISSLEEEPEMSVGLESILNAAQACAENCEKEVVELAHLVHGFYVLEESYAIYYIETQGITQTELLMELGTLAEEVAERRYHSSQNGQQKLGAMELGYDLDEDEEEDNGSDQPSSHKKHSGFEQYALCLNENLEGVNPLIGREEELERTIQILCRKDKNNPLHIGEPGVGKTAIAYGLARMLNENRAPKPLTGAKIYSLDLGSLLAGTQYRGDFEKRFREVMEGIEQEENPIVYLDEIHNIVGAGAVNGGSFDASNMLKPYLAEGRIRFIGATTYDEYKKHFEKSKSLVRRFQNVEIREPSEADTICILEGLKKHYEAFHGVKYAKGVLEYAVRMSARYINERHLPDKAIDLIDEAGAYRKLHPLEQKSQMVSKALIDEILSKTCHIPKQVVENDEVKKLASLDKRMKARVFGQDEAVDQVVNAVKFSRAGLLEEGKPLASLLFVGPTGVGKTEIAKSLADELGVQLIRFDMSEYEEKHAIAKLIGAPAGYVGYEEGGLLTEAIRKQPHSVLLLDEIEKAHPDIFNLLLQVMDYATLTDNQGRKADFRNVLLIMTSNAGARQAGKAQIGFGGLTSNVGAMEEEVKRTFQPEFRNRLNRLVIFNRMDDKMAELIVDKKLKELSTLLGARQVTLIASDEARRLVKQKGITLEYGAREIERVIGSEIKPLLVDELLFGKLKKGGSCQLDVKDGKLSILIKPELKSAKTAINPVKIDGTYNK